MLDVEIGELAELVLTSTAATLALPGPGGEPSEFVVSVEVGERGSFSWLPEPMVLVGGCDHHTVTTISLAKGARLVWREEFVLGRHDEEPGSGMLDVRIDYDGRPLLRTGSRAGPRWQSWPTPAVASDARAVGMFVLVDPGLDGGLRVEEEVAPGCVLTSLDGPALVVSALASSAIELREMLDAGRREAQTVVNS